MATSTTQEGAESLFREVFEEAVRTALLSEDASIQDRIVAQVKERASGREDLPAEPTVNRDPVQKARDTIRAHFVRVWDETADKDVLESHVRTLWRVLFDAVKNLPFQKMPPRYYYKQHSTLARIVWQLVRLGTLRRSEEAQANDTNPDLPTIAVLPNGQFMFGDIPYFTDDLLNAFTRVMYEQTSSEHLTNLHLFVAYLAFEASGSLQRSLLAYGLFALREALEQYHRNPSEIPDDPSAPGRAEKLSLNQFLVPALLWLYMHEYYLRKATIDPGEFGGTYIDMSSDYLSGMGELAIRANVVNCTPLTNEKDLEARGRWHFWRARFDAIHKSIPENAQGAALEARTLALEGHELMVGLDSDEKDKKMYETATKVTRCCVIL